MLFKLILDENCQEEIIAKVRERTPLIDKIERLALNESLKVELVGYSDDEIVVLNLNDIDCFVVESERTYAVIENCEKLLVKKRLHELEAFLPESFERISKSAIANREKIVKFKVQLSGAVDAVFKSGYVECISRRCFAEIKRRYKL